MEKPEKPIYVAGPEEQARINEKIAQENKRKYLENFREKYAPLREFIDDLSDSDMDMALAIENNLKHFFPGTDKKENVEAMLGSFYYSSRNDQLSRRNSIIAYLSELKNQLPVEVLQKLRDIMKRMFDVKD